MNVSDFNPASATTQAVRVQRSRRRGSRLPENTVCVSRGNKYGNPFAVGDEGIRDVSTAVDLFRTHFRAGKLHVTPTDARRELKGKNLACWCPLDQPCHADVLLEDANTEE